MLQPEQILNERYQLKEKLGHNAGRQTWLAEDLNTEPRELVIVKLLAFGGEVQWDEVKLFEREAQVLKQLNHPRIPKYRDSFCLDDRMLWFCLVQEYIPGVSLKEHLNQRKRFTEAQVRKIAADVLEILGYLHQLKPSVLHRDIKPSNLVFTEHKQIYLVDFGAVQDRAAQEGVTFTVVGTYGYAPMEQFGGRAIPASDLYALGATLIHLLTGIAPADLPQKDLRIQFKDSVTLAPSFVSWIDKLTEPVPERRFTTAKEALEALESGIVLNRKTTRYTQTRTITQPENTRVRVSKSPEQLRIVIPPHNIKSMLDLPKFLGMVFLVIGTAYVGVRIWSLEMILGSFFLVALTFNFLLPTLAFYFGGTDIIFNRKRFYVARLFLNVVYLQQNWSTSSIQYVFCREKTNINEVVIQVTNQLTKHQYVFGRSLTQAEQAWLVQEIQMWLNFT